MCTIRYAYKILIKVKFSRQIFENYSNIKFHKNSSIGSRVVPNGRKDGRTDMTKPTVAVGNLANARKKRSKKGEKL
jgi:hypothetical protein